MEVSCRQTTLGSRHRGNGIRLPAPDRSITPPRSADPARTRRPEKSVLDRSRTAPVPLVPAPADDCTDELSDAPDRRAASAWIEDGPTAPPDASPPHSTAPAASARPRLLHSPPPTTADNPGGARGWTGTQATRQWHGTGAPGDEDSDVESLAHNIQIDAPRCQIRQGSPKRQIGGYLRAGSDQRLLRAVTNSKPSAARIAEYLFLFMPRRCTAAERISAGYGAGILRLGGLPQVSAGITL